MVVSKGVAQSGSLEGRTVGKTSHEPNTRGPTARLTPIPRPQWLPESIWPFQTSGLEVDGAIVAVTDVGRGPALLLVHTGLWSFIRRDVMIRLCAHFHLEVFNQHRSLLFSIAYRMLGSVADAEDMLQDAFMRWEETSNTQIESPKAFLVTIISRLCINHLQSARVRREQYFGQWLPEPLLTMPASDPFATGIDESLSMAFLLLLERLTPAERAVFLVREVLTANTRKLRRSSVRAKAMAGRSSRRAKQHVTEKLPRFDVSPQEQERLLQGFLEATSLGDMQGLLALLSRDVVLYTGGGGKATAVPKPVYGPDRVARFFLGAREKLIPKDLVRRLAEINGQPGIIAYHRGRVIGVFTMDVVGGRILNIYIVSNPDKLARFPT